MAANSPGYEAILQKQEQEQEQEQEQGVGRRKGGRLVDLPKNAKPTVH